MTATVTDRRDALGSREPLTYELCGWTRAGLTCGREPGHTGIHTWEMKHR